MGLIAKEEQAEWESKVWTCKATLALTLSVCA